MQFQAGLLAVHSQPEIVLIPRCNLAQSAPFAPFENRSIIWTLSSSRRPGTNVVTSAATSSRVELSSCHAFVDRASLGEEIKHEYAVCVATECGRRLVEVHFSIDPFQEESRVLGRRSRGCEIE